MHAAHRSRAAALAAAAVLALLVPAGIVGAQADEPPPPTLTVVPDRVTAGTPVTVSGDGCPGGTVTGVIPPGEGLEVTADPEGRWSTELGTSTLGPGPVPVDASCASEDATFSYATAAFEVTVPTPAPPEPAEPAPGRPGFTG